jgi:hypothetical protein
MPDKQIEVRLAETARPYGWKRKLPVGHSLGVATELTILHSLMSEAWLSECCGR